MPIATISVLCQNPNSDMRILEPPPPPQAAVRPAATPALELPLAGDYQGLGGPQEHHYVQACTDVIKRHANQNLGHKNIWQKLNRISI